MYSNYQRIKAGFLSRHYSKLDVLIEKKKINTILLKYKTFNKKQEQTADKLLKTYRENIEFICRMLNQQVIESY